MVLDTVPFLSGHSNSNGYQLCPPLPAKLFLLFSESHFLDDMIRCSRRKLGSPFNLISLCFRYIYDQIVSNNKKFWKYVKDIYPSQLNVKKTYQSDILAGYLGRALSRIFCLGEEIDPKNFFEPPPPPPPPVDSLTFTVGLTFTAEREGKLSTKLHYKHDDFYFHIVNFPFLSRNITSGPFYSAYISRLIRYARCYSYYDDLRHCHEMPVERLLSQTYRYERL